MPATMANSTQYQYSGRPARPPNVTYFAKHVLTAWPKDMPALPVVPRMIIGPVPERNGLARRCDSGRRPRHDPGRTRGGRNAARAGRGGRGGDSAEHRRSKAEHAVD